MTNDTTQVDDSLPRAYLIRTHMTDEHTLGTFSVPGVFQCYTLERAWKENQSNISCVPAGEYECVIRVSPRFGKVYWLLRVPERSYILIHSGNLVRHTHGCILVGAKRGYMQGERAVLLSRPTLRRLMSTFAGQPFKLTIIGGDYAS